MTNAPELVFDGVHAPNMPPLTVEKERPFSLFENWPAPIFYFPIVLYYIWLAIRYRSLTLVALANPAIEGGGLIGESKIQVLSLLGPEGKKLLAPLVHFVTSGTTALDTQEALKRMEEAGLTFPVVVKPDISKRGTGVWVIKQEADLEEYFSKFPAGGRVLLQKLIDYEGEAGVFYVRMPGEEKGRIVSLTLKYFPRVVGDGSSTLAELIKRDPRAGKLTHIYFPRHEHMLNRVLKRGEPFRLVFAGNHCRGAVFCDGARYITPQMEARFDAIAKEIPDFYFGRFDVRFPALSTLQDGSEFAIIEFNGVGSEPVHIWDREMRLGEAYRVLFKNWRTAFEIGARNRARGCIPTSVRELARLYAREANLMQHYPPTQ